MIAKAESRSPWSFVPTTYFAEGLPYILINSASVILYKNMGVSNAEMAFWTSWLYLPWVIKMLWGPMVDMYGTRRGWVVWTQLMLAACLGAAALSLTGQHFFAVSLLAFAAGAFVSATHDIAVDGFYMLALAKGDQAFFVGIRSMCYRLAMIFGTGFLVFRAGKMQEAGYTPGASWSAMLGISAAVFVVLFLYHKFALPHPAEDQPKAEFKFSSILPLLGYLAAAGLLIWFFTYLERIAGKVAWELPWLSPAVWFAGLPAVWKKLGAAAVLVAALLYACKVYIFPKLRNKLAEEGNSFNEAFVSYFTMDGIGYIVAFILFYRLAEAMLLKMTQPFLLDAVDKGGLAISTAQVGVIYGIIGLVSLIIGGLAGGWLLSKYGFRRCLWPMVLTLHIPDVFYLYMAYAQPGLQVASIFGREMPVGIVPLLVAAEQLGYGIGLTAFTVYLMRICKGKYKTAHFAISTGIMALGMMVPGMISGMLQQAVGYKHFFLWVCILTIPGILVIFKLPQKDDEPAQA